MGISNNQLALLLFFFFLTEILDISYAQKKLIALASWDAINPHWVKWTHAADSYEKKGKSLPSN